MKQARKYTFLVYFYTKTCRFWSERQKNVNRSANADEHLNYEPMQKATRAASRRKTSNRSINTLMHGLDENADTHLVLGVASGIQHLDTNLEHVCITHVQKHSQLLVLAGRHVTHVHVIIENSYRIVIIRILVLAHKTQPGTNLQLRKNSTTLIVAKTRHIATQIESFLLFNLHNRTKFNS